MKNLKNKLSYAIYIVLATVLLVGCDPTVVRKFESMTPPIVLVAESTDKTVIVADAENTVLVIPTGYYLSSAISDTYNVNDTLSYIK
jgi:hypothetical protein